MIITQESFKKLLHLLKEKDISLKVRTHTGWSKDYLQIIGFISSMNDQMNQTFGGVVLSNVSETEGILINNISTITAFELDCDCEPFTAKVVYPLRDTLHVKALVVE